jgi:hypothetical protein
VRIEVGGGLPSPSDEGGLEEFVEFSPNRRRNSMFSTRRAAFSTRKTIQNLYLHNEHGLPF